MRLVRLQPSETDRAHSSMYELGCVFKLVLDGIFEYVAAMTDVRREKRPERKDKNKCKCRIRPNYPLFLRKQKKIITKKESTMCSWNRIGSIRA